MSSHSRTALILLSCLLTAILLAGAGSPRAQVIEKGEYMDMRPAVEWPDYPDPPEDAPDPSVAVYFDLASRSTELHAEPREVFDIYVVAHDVPIALRAWELMVDIDPRISIVSTESKGHNFGQDNNWHVGLKPPGCLSGETIVLIHHKAVILEEGLEDLIIQLGPVFKSSFDPRAPGFLICRPEIDMRPFASWCDTCAVVNPLEIRVTTEEDQTPPSVLEPARERY